jgi:hypothetical protein
LVDDDPVQLTAGDVITCGTPADFVTWGHVGCRQADQ